MSSESVVLSPPSHVAVWNDNDAQFYLQGLEQSDYAARLGSLVGELLAGTRSLLDIGAGAGTLPASFLARDATWTAVEPNNFLADRLEQLGEQRGSPIQVIRTIWQELGGYRLAPHESVLAANMCGPLDNPASFWETLAPLCSRTMVWTVPAQRGPRRACLSGALPASLHGEDEVPAVELVLDALPASMQPDEVHFADWTFSYQFADFDAANRYFQARFNAQADAVRAAALRTHLHQTVTSTDQGVSVHSPKKGACLVWHF